MTQKGTFQGTVAGIQGTNNQPVQYEVIMCEVPTTENNLNT